MNGHDADTGGPLRFRRGPSCFWLVSAPLFFGYCLVFYGSGLYFMVTEKYGWLCLLYLLPGSLFVYRWAKAFRVGSASFDRVRETVTIRWGVFIPLRVREYHFSEIEALQLSRRMVRTYRKTVRPVYPVSALLGNGKPAPLLDYDDYFPARHLAEQAAAYLALPLIDASVTPPQVIPAEQVGQPLRSAEPGGRVKPTLSPAPRRSRCRITWEEETAVVRLPIMGRTYLVVKSVKWLLFFAVVVGAVAFTVWWLTGDSRQTTRAALGMVLLFCLPLMFFFLLRGVLFTFRRTTIRVAADGLQYRSRALLYGSTRRIPHGELKSIRLDGSVIEILTLRERLRFGDKLTAVERAWLCESLNKLAAG